MDSPLPSDAKLAEIIATAEEILLHVRRVARRMQERILKTLGEPPPGADAGGDRPPCPDARGMRWGSGCP